MNNSTPRPMTGGLAVLACSFAAAAQAALIVNGGFESGLASWTIANQTGSEGSFATQTGTLSPVSSTSVPAPPEGTTAAMTDAFGPGSHVLYQDFVVPTGLTGGSISFSLYINNGAAEFVTPGHLNFGSTDLNQQARADILVGGADPFSTASGDVLLNLYQTMAGAPLVSGYDDVVVDISALVQAHAGQTLRLRFAEVDNINMFNLGVDAVNIQVVPEPGSWSLLAGLGCLIGAGCFRRWRQQGQPGSDANR